MKLRAKIFLIVAVVLCVFFFVTSYLLTKTLKDDFALLESQEARENALRTKDAFNSKIEDLSVKLYDWSNWDDTYQFVQDGNAEYVKSNLQNEALELLKMNMAVFMDEEGEVIFKKYVDRSGEEIVFSEDLEGNLILIAKLLSDENSTKDEYKGVLVTKDGAMAIAVQKVTSSDGTAPAKGTVAFGFSLDKDALEEISSLTHLDSSYALYEGEITDDGFGNAKSFLSPGNPIHIETPAQNEQFITGYILIEDIFGKPALILSSENDRHIDNQGKKTISLIVKIMVLLSTMFILLVFSLFEFLVLRRISKLIQEVRDISEKDNKTDGLSVAGNDEFSDLGKEINKMLAALHAAEMERRENEGRFQILADSAPVIIWTADKEGNFTYVNRKMVDVTGRSPEDNLGEGWKKNIYQLDLPRVNAVLDQNLGKEQAFSLKYRLQKKDGSYRWILIEAMPEINYKGEFVGYLGSGFDVTDLEDVNERKLEYIREIENMNKIMVSRELKMIELKDEIGKLKKNGKPISDNI